MSAIDDVRVTLCFPVLTRAPLGGGGEYRPLPDILDNSKTAADIDAKLSIPSPASIRRLSLKFQTNQSRIFFFKWRFSDVMFHHFW